MGVSTPQNQTLTLNPIVMTLQGNATTSMGKWRPLMKRKMPLPVAEPP